MPLPNLSLLSIHDDPGGPSKRAPDPNWPLRKYKEYIKSIPYAAEPESKLIEMLEFIVLRLEQCVTSRDYEVGFLQWDSMLSYWSLLKYPIPKETRIKLAKIYWYMSTTPGMPGQIMATCADGFKSLTQSVKKLTIKDMRLPWRPVYEILSKDLFLTRRQFEYTQLPWVMGYIAANSRRFFHPAAANEMLSTFVPLINNTDLDYVLAAQFYLLTFLPLSHPQAYLPMLFRIWESINSYMFDERMLEFLASLSEMHVASDVSDPRKLAELPDDAKSEGEGRPQWSEDDLNATSAWPGIYKDVGVFTEHEWSLLMCKCINSMEIPLADGGSLTTGPSADRNVAGEIGRLPKPEWRIQSLARIIVYSMAPDGMPSPASNAPTPFLTPMPSGMNTPQIPTHNSLRDYLSAPLGMGPTKNKTYLAGCKALESLSQIIASTESFFHPSNSGPFTNDLAAFIKQIAYDFNRRWLEEQQPECKTPTNRRLTKQMKRELVKTLRTVAFLAMFCEDSNTVGNIQSCLKSMSVMEPDLILHPILERAFPALETLIETQRTIAVIKALGAVAPAIVSRKVYYPGAKHLIPILQLLIPGIDLNDPTKTLHTTEFIVEVAQYIMFADAMPDDANGTSASRPETPSRYGMPSFFMDESDREFPRLTDEEEDRLVQDTTGSFADWVTQFIRRVYQLQENLPEEGGGAAEVQVVDAVGRACMSICSHLSASLYDLVLNLVYDYASTTVRSNAVRGIHLLIEALANANPVKCLAKFFPLCERSIRLELENGASSLRTTAASSPMPSDATLHWHLAILRGCVFNDGNAILPYKDRLVSLLKLLNEKTFSNRGFAWSGKLLCNVLLTLTHTYPLENKFVNPEEWNSEEFRRKHYLYWGKVYKADEVTVSWHVPNSDEIDFSCQIFRELVEPALNLLIKLLEPGAVRNTVWSNDFCRHLSFVSNAFSGIPTLIRDVFKPDALRAATKTSDILNEIEEMIGVIEPMNSGFALTDPADPRYAYLSSLRRRFGEFLHDASKSLSQQGEENTVDAVEMLIEGIRTYMLEYGDSKEQGCEKKYHSEKNVARLIAKQKTWPRSVWVRRARFYHSARLRWNSLERLRGPLEDLLIDDLVEWSLWNYATIRSYSQSILDSICVVYDGVRRRAFPVLYQALESGDDDRMKGALWTLNLMNFGKYAASELTLAPKLVQNLFLCQKNEKPSIQDSVSVVSENCLNSLPEPCSLVYDVETPELDAIFAGIGFSQQDQQLIQKCTDNRKLRVQLMDKSSEELMSIVLAVGNSSKTHWKYEIAAIRCLRAVIRRDAPLEADKIRYFLEKTRDSNPSMRYYAQRAVMKALRNLKLRTFCRKPTDLILGRNHNPLKERVPIDPSPELTRRFLDAYKVPLDLKNQGPVFVDKDPLGWLTWSRKQSHFRIPDAVKSTFQPWEPASEAAIAVVREIALTTAFWKELGMYFGEENHEVSIIMDNVSLVKSIFQLLEDEPFEALKPTVEALVSDKEPDKQRALAEFTAGLIGGSKHWPLSKQDMLWKWFKPIMADIFGPNLKTDTVSIWTSFLEYISYNKDPRRLQPLVDHLMNIWMDLDYQPELAFDTTKLLSVLKGFAETINWKFTAWTDEVVARCWSQLELTEHEEIRSSIADILAFSSKIKATPRPSFPSTEVFVKECRILPVDYDIMGMRGYYHKARIAELVTKFPVWREERAPGSRAFQSTYDRVGITVCKFLFQLLLDTSATRVFDYILPLMPELFRFTEVNDNEDLATRGNDVLVQMCGVSPPRSLINPIFDAIFEAIQNSPSWRVRIKALPLVQVFYFRQLPLISDGKVMEILEVLCKCLDDEVVDVREMAATTLSGILRLSPRRHILKLRDRFVQLIKKSHIPARQDPGYARGVRQRHAAILGVCALVDSVPYTVEKWTPDLLTNILAEHTYDPAPISTTVRKCARNFSRTHIDTWHEDCVRFSEDQLAMLSNLLTGSSYYA